MKILGLLTLGLLLGCSEPNTYWPTPDAGPPDLTIPISTDPMVRAFLRVNSAGGIEAQGNDTGQPNTVEHRLSPADKGIYEVTIPGHPIGEGVVNVSTVGGGSALCQVGATLPTIQVVCHVPATQTPTDSAFNLLFVR